MSVKRHSLTVHFSSLVSTSVAILWVGASLTPFNAEARSDAQFECSVSQNFGSPEDSGFEQPYLSPLHWQTATASTYGDEKDQGGHYKFRGHPTACGRKFHPDTEYTVASLLFPLGTTLDFRYHGVVVQATVTDFGPFIAGRSFDLSSALNKKLSYSTDDALEYRIVPRDLVDCGPRTGRSYWLIRDPHF